MKIHRLHIKNFRCFPYLDLTLGNINILVGPNNVGKSSILRAVSIAQAGSFHGDADIRAGESEAEITLVCDHLDPFPVTSGTVDKAGTVLRINFPRQPTSIRFTDDLGKTRGQIPERSKETCVVPYYSKRKLMGYVEEIRSTYATGAFNMSYLTSKLALITVPSCPGHDQYVAACKAILGFVLSPIPAENGSRPGIFLPDGTPLYLDQMGEGVPSIAALLIELVTAKDKIFLIEEPENDLHPSALKALLEMILSSADRNQFIITTHSNIVVQYLGSGNGALHEVKKVDSELPTAIVERVEDTVFGRSEVLRSLGYALSDFDLWDGWLILEESSAERIIRDFLIPYFVPRLTSLRLLSSNGIDNAEPTFASLHRMVLFTHLEEIYRHSTWVRLDGDQAGLNVTGRMKNAFTQAREGQFGNFAKQCFEYYYPEHFADRIESVLAVADPRVRREQKRQLLLDVIEWLRENESRARESLAQSAEEIIDFLREVDASMRQSNRIAV